MLSYKKIDWAGRLEQNKKVHTREFYPQEPGLFIIELNVSFMFIWRLCIRS